MQNEEKKENKLKRFWYKHGDFVVSTLLTGAISITGTCIGFRMSRKCNTGAAFKHGREIGRQEGVNVTQRFIKKRIPEAYEIINTYYKEHVK